MPVANLQSYHTVALHVRSTAFASQGLATFLERSLTAQLRQKCGFDAVGRETPADVVLDLNITQAGRGGDGILRNQSQATIDTLLVLSDGQSGELLGTARIHGKSSGVIINGGSPETEAVDVVAQTIADVLAKSGCSGPRVARVEPPPPPPEGSDTPPPPPPPHGSNTPPPPPVDESHRAQAEALNDQGKQKLISADVPGALAAFQQAVQVLPDPRYQFNVCLALEAQEQWDPAVSACRQAKTMNPQPALAAKIDGRIDLIQHHQ